MVTLVNTQLKDRESKFVAARKWIKYQMYYKCFFFTHSFPERMVLISPIKSNFRVHKYEEFSQDKIREK